MKKQIIALLIIMAAGFPGHLLRAAEIPQNVTLSATVSTITVTWTRETLAEGYYVYWGTTSGNLSNRDQVDSSANTYTISGLLQGTVYYVAVSSFSAGTESQKSSVKSITTTQDKLAPEVPSGLDVTALSAVTGTSVTLRWNANSGSDLSHYNVYQGTASGIYGAAVQADKNAPASFTVTGLSPSGRYYFAVSAVDESDNESDVSDEIIIDTLPDTRPPNVPSGVSGRMSGIREITVRIDNGNSGMVDFAGHIIHYGTETGRYAASLDIGKNMSHVFSDVPEGVTWYFAVTAYDAGGNESQGSAEVSVDVEDTRSFLDTDTFEGGCFIASAGSWRPAYGWILAGVWVFFIAGCVLGHRLLFARRIVDPAPGMHGRRRRTLIVMMAMILFVWTAPSDARAGDKAPGNIAGVSAGWLIPAESEFEDYYGDDTYPVFAFFERRFGKFVSMGIESGFMKKTGKRLTVSGDPTDIGTRFTLVPVTASLKLHMKLFPYVSGFVGAGPDYWYCRERTRIKGSDPEIEEWVGGWHGRAGLTLYNMDPRYENTGAVIEAVYSEIDRFGDNGQDIGGVTIRLGLFYGF